MADNTHNSSQLEYDDIYYNSPSPWKERFKNAQQLVNKNNAGTPSKFGQFVKGANSFLTNSNGYGSLISSGLDMVGNLIKPPPGYEGKRGNIQQGLDTAYDTAANAIMAVPGWGTAVGLGMKALGVLNKGVQRLGGGTDGMTTTDAILNSNFFGLTPLGLINGIGGKRANTYSRNTQLDTASASGFGGFQELQNVTQVGAGKKYGLFSSGARNKQNALTEYTQGIKHTISGIVDYNTLNNMAVLGTTPYVAQQQNMDLSGGIQMLRAARKGTKLNYMPGIKVQKKLKTYKQKFYDPEGMTVDRDKYDEVFVDGKRYFIKSDQTYYSGDPVPTKDGDLLYKKSDGKFIKYPYSKSLYNKKGGKFIQNVLNKYQYGNSLKRVIQVFDVGSSKYVQIPIPLSKDQIAGRMPIRLANGTAVFMNGDGTVTSDRWETLGKREHLTPKGQDGGTINNKLSSFKKGGQMNVIPEGALHARKNHLTEIDDMYKQVTHKGIPVITIEDSGEIIQHAEVEHSEIIFTKEVTDKIEAYRKKGTDEAAIECGKLLVQEILYNTDDRTGLINTIE